METTLVVEDDSEIQALLEDFLVEAGYAVHVCSDGAQALLNYGDADQIDGRRGRVQSRRDPQRQKMRSAISQKLAREVHCVSGGRKAPSRFAVSCIRIECMINSYMGEDCQHKRTSVTHICCHSVFCLKYRRKIFNVEGVVKRFKKLVPEICKRNEFELLALECNVDHCHIFVHIPLDTSAAGLWTHP